MRVEVSLKASKNAMRRELQRKTAEFLERGGEIKQHHAGDSGERADQPRSRPVFVSGQQPQERTYLNELVLELDSRKRKTKSPAASKAVSRPRKKIIYDDFGEPLREVWTEG
ncbi:MAG TPA: hypothetical protein DD440_08205 [Porticoccaceae bacterium]|nr:hypothetical protein [Porticoccaceae bacterium]